MSVGSKRVEAAGKQRIEPTDGFWLRLLTPSLIHASHFARCCLRCHYSTHRTTASLPSSTFISLRGCLQSYPASVCCSVAPVLSLALSCGSIHSSPCRSLIPCTASPAVLVAYYSRRANWPSPHRCAALAHIASHHSTGRPLPHLSQGHTKQHTQVETTQPCMHWTSKHTLNRLSLRCGLLPSASLSRNRTLLHAPLSHHCCDHHVILSFAVIRPLSER